MRIGHIAALCAATIAPLSAHAVDAKLGDAASDGADRVLATRLTIIPPAVSRTLDMKAVTLPTSEPVPITISSWWDCLINENGFEECDYHLAFCADDGFCTQVH